MFPSRCISLSTTHCMTATPTTSFEIEAAEKMVVFGSIFLPSTLSYAQKTSLSTVSTQQAADDHADVQPFRSPRSDSSRSSINKSVLGPGRVTAPLAAQRPAPSLSGRVVPRPVKVAATGHSWRARRLGCPADGGAARGLGAAAALLTPTGRARSSGRTPIF